MKIITRQTSFEDERGANVKLCCGLKLKPLKLAIFQPVNVQMENPVVVSDNSDKPLYSQLIIKVLLHFCPNLTKKKTVTKFDKFASHLESFVLIS